MVLSTSPLHGLASLSALFPRSSILYFKDIKHGVGELVYISPSFMFFLMYAKCSLSSGAASEGGDVSPDPAGVDMRANKGLSLSALKVLIMTESITSVKSKWKLLKNNQPSLNTLLSTSPLLLVLDLLNNMNH